MPTDSASWYLPGESKKPAGPFTAEQIFQSLGAKRLNAATLVWQDGMPNWLPLAQVEPFAAVIRATAEKPRGHGILRRIVGLLLLLVLLSVAAAGLYVYWNESNTISKAKALIAAEDYKEAATVLRPLFGNTYFYRDETSYLSAIAAIRQLASAAETEDDAEDSLKRPTKSLHDLFVADEAWRQQAKTDLAGALELIPKKASDGLERSVMIAAALDELKLADAKQLAKGLLAKLRTSAEFHHGPEDGSAAVVAYILHLDPSLSATVVASVLPEADESAVRMGSAALQQWSRQKPILAKPLAAAILVRATDLMRARQTASAKTAIDAVERICPNLRETCNQKRLDWVKNSVVDKNYAGAMQGIDGICFDSQSATISADAAAVCLDIARRSPQSDLATAQRALDTAFKLNKQLANSEDNIWLWLELHPQATEEKREMCQRYLDRFPKGEHTNDVADILAKTKKDISNGQSDQSPGIPAPPGGKLTPLPEDLDVKLRKHRGILGTPNDVYAAVANKEIWIIEVTDTCTVRDFNAEQKRLLRNWVAEGHVLWANNDVLDLFGIGHSIAVDPSFARCMPATGGHPILEGVKTVRLEDLKGKSLGLDKKGAIPLLVVKHEDRNPYWEPPAGTVVWSLVPYGKGWISDPKPMKLNVDSSPWSREIVPGQNALFWSQFCQFCLKEIPWPPANANVSHEESKEIGGESQPKEGPLAGKWETTDGNRYSIEDDGDVVTLKLVNTGFNGIAQLTGKLARHGKPDAKKLDGTVRLTINGDKPRSIGAVLFLDAPDQIRVQCSKWPVFDGRKFLLSDSKSQEWSLTRAQSDESRPPSPFGRHR